MNESGMPEGDTVGKLPSQNKKSRREFGDVEVTEPYFITSYMPEL